MLRKFILMGAILATSVATVPAQTKPPAADSSAKAVPTGIDIPTMNKRIETFLRTTYAWGPAFDIKVEPPKTSPDPYLIEVSVTVSM